METIVIYFAPILGLQPESVLLGMAILSLVFTALTLILGPPLAFFWYKKRRYLDHITYSMNELHPQDDGTTLLRIRTVELLPWSDLLPSNWYLHLKILFAIRRCTLEQPLILMGMQDMDVFQPSLISGLSKLFNEGMLADIAGLPVVRHDYLIVPTFEKYGDSATFKLRVMIVCERDLEKFNDEAFCKTVRFEREHHKNRLTTLCRMAERRAWEVENTTVDEVRAVRAVQGTFRK